MAKFLYHDTETTGIASEDRIIETAHLLVENGKLIEHIEDLCKPDNVKIKPAAAATHGYRNSDIKSKPSFNDTVSASKLIQFSEEDIYYVAHNAPFDLGMLAKEGISFSPKKVIDTLRVARHMYADNEMIEMYKLQYFRYVFEKEDGTDEFEDLEREYMKQLNVTHIQPHTALSDILVLWIFHEKLAKDFNLSADDMVRLSQQPTMERGIQFGNVFEKGKPYSDIMNESYTQFGKTKRGYEYLMWAVENMAMSLDREYTIKSHLARGLINGQISSLHQHEKYLNWGLLFVFDEEETQRALNLTFADADFLEKLKNAYIKRAEEFLASVEKQGEDASSEDIEKATKEKFFYNYFMNYRR